MEKIITVDMWEERDDGLFYAEVPFECDPEADTIMEFTDSNDYIQEHKEDFDLLNNGESDGTKCTISADAKPSCDMKIEIKTIDEAGGRIMYDKHGNPEYIPPESNGFAGLAGMFGAMGGMGNVELPADIQNQIQDVIDVEAKSTESKEEQLEE